MKFLILIIIMLFTATSMAHKIGQAELITDEKETNLVISSITAEKMYKTLKQKIDTKNYQENRRPVKLFSKKGNDFSCSKKIIKLENSSDWSLPEYTCQFSLMENEDGTLTGDIK